MVVYEVSEEVYFYDRNGSWQISELKTSLEEAPSVTAILNQPLSATKKLLALYPHPFDLASSARMYDSTCITAVES